MKNTLSVKLRNDKYIISDISIALFPFFNFSSTDKVIGTELKTSFLISYLNLLKNSTINYLEFFYKIEKSIFKIQIIKQENENYILYFEDSGIDELTHFTQTCNDTIKNFLETDKDLIELINLKNKDLKTYQLEIIYLLKNIREELKELKEKNIEQDDLFIQKENFSLSFIIEKLGVKNLILFLFAISLIESFILEPLIQPIATKLIDNIQESVIVD